MNVGRFFAGFAVLMLGACFAAARIGDAVTAIVAAILACECAYCLGRLAEQETTP